MRKVNLTSILDYLFIVMFSILALYLLSVPRKPPTEGLVDPKVEFMIEIEWNNKSNDDVDLFLKTPLNEIIFFKNKSINVYNLERDDTGQISDSILQPDGSYVPVYVNYEVITMRGFYPGLYRANILMYSKRDIEPTEVTIRFRKMNPYKVIIERKIILSSKSEEKTAVNFMIDADGHVKHFDYNYESITKDLNLEVSGSP